MMKNIFVNKKFLVGHLAVLVFCAFAVSVYGHGHSKGRGYVHGQEREHAHDEGGWFEEFNTPAGHEAAPAVVAPMAPEAAPAITEAVPAMPEAVNAEQEAAPVMQPAIIDAPSLMRHGIELSTRALASAPFVLAERSVKTANGQILKPKDRVTFLLYDRAIVKPIGNDFHYSVGDTVDILSRGRRVPLKGASGLLFERKGRGVIVGVAEKLAAIQIIELWVSITGGERITQTQAFSPVFVGNLIAPTSKVEGKVIMRLDEISIPLLHQYIVIDRGSANGVRVGDFFRVTERKRSNRLSEDVLEAQVVSVSPITATLVIQQIYKNGLEVGDRAVLTLRSEEMK